MAANLRPGHIGHIKERHHLRGAQEKLARFRPMNEVIRFMSRCPKCGDRRLQEGYTHRMLRRFLNTGIGIEAYCSECHALWTISSLERDGIVIGLCD
jgi:hypothetical protein